MFKKLFSEIDELQKRINKMRPLNQVQLNRLKDYFKIGLTYTSNAIEGNSMTLVETQIILRDGLTVSGKSLREHFEVVGHGEDAAAVVAGVEVGKKLLGEGQLADKKPRNRGEIPISLLFCYCAAISGARLTFGAGRCSAVQRS